MGVGSGKGVKAKAQTKRKALKALKKSWIVGRFKVKSNTGKTVMRNRMHNNVPCGNHGCTSCYPELTHIEEWEWFGDMYKSGLSASQRWQLAVNS